MREKHQLCNDICNDRRERERGKVLERKGICLGNALKCSIGVNDYKDLRKQ